MPRFPTYIRVALAGRLISHILIFLWLHAIFDVHSLMTNRSRSIDVVSGKVERCERLAANQPIRSN